MNASSSRPTVVVPASARWAAGVALLAALVVFASHAVQDVAFGQPREGEVEAAASEAREVFLPQLEGVGEDGTPCSVEIVIQSIADEPRKAILLYWSAPATEPDPDPSAPLTGGAVLKVECTGLIKPGMSWRVSGPMIPAGARSAAVYSVTTKYLTEIGVPLEADDIVADYLCEALFFGVVGDRADTLRYRRAVREGGDFAGLPMDRAVGAPLSVFVDRTCGDRFLRYAGIGGSVDALEPSAPGAPFSYSSPWLGGAPASPGGSAITAMNAGLADASVDVFVAPTGAVMSGAGAGCPPPTACGTFRVAPGEAIVVDPAAAGCAPAEGTGRLWIESNAPLGVIVEGLGPAGWASASARRADAPAPSAIGSVAPPVVDGIDVLSAPLVYHEHRGWSTIVHLANDASREASVRVSVVDRSGDVIAGRDVAICPRGARSVDLDAEFADLPGDLVASLRVESIGASGAAGSVAAVGVTVELGQRGAGGTAGVAVDSAVYEVLPAADGDVLVGIPSLAKFVGDLPTTRLAIQNRASPPGFTDFVIYLYDSSGLLDYVCDKLNEREVDYIDLASWGYVNPGFDGSALVSATYWEHDAFDAAGRWTGNRAALGVVAFDARDPAPASLGAPVDPAVLASAIMPPAFGSGVLSPLEILPICSSLPFRPTRTPTPTGPSLHRVYLPWVTDGAAMPDGPVPIFP